MSFLDKIETTPSQSKSKEIIPNDDMSFDSVIKKLQKSDKINIMAL
jgi:hypothetical protein